MAPKRFALVSLVTVAAFAGYSDARGTTVLWTTGAARTIDYQFTTFRSYTGFGYVSGYYDATMPQRWAAVPFRLDEPSRITQLDAYYSNPKGYATNVEYRVWNRTNLEAPTSVAATGSLGPYVSVANEEAAAYQPSLHLHQNSVDVTLPAGNYYLSIYATGPAWIAWWTGGGLQDSALESNYIWRSLEFPSPGFLPWTFTGSSNLLADPRDVYNLAFTLGGTASAGTGDYNLDGTVDGSDFLAWQRAMGSNDWRADGNANGVVDEDDLTAWKDALSSHSQGNPIPEPSTGVLAIFLLTPFTRVALRRSRTDTPTRRPELGCPWVSEWH
jgi:hypothetical protein